MSILKRFYMSALAEVDFKNNPRGAENRINRWVEEQTAEKIREPVSGLSHLTRLVITNASYFKANWSRRFEPQNTKNGTFYTPNGTVTTPMMHQKGRFRYIEGEHFQAIEIPYEDGKLNMVIILPERGRLNEIEEKPTPRFVDDVVKGMKEESVKLTLLKFRFERRYLLKGILMGMGMKKACVAENGTEAAAATAVVMTAAAAPRTKSGVQGLQGRSPLCVLHHRQEDGANTLHRTARKSKGLSF
nr:serpin family protein [Thermococcus sp.]